MPSTWNEIHQHFVRASSSLSFQRSFDLLRRRHTSLSRFADPVALLDALHRGSGACGQKNTVLRALVEAAQSGQPAGDCALTVLLLALWPGVDAVRRRSIWRRIGPADEVASDILARTIEAVHGLDLGRVQRIAATILMNIERDLGRDHVREARRQNLHVDLDVDQIVGRSGESPVSMGLVRRDLARLVGDDAVLVLRVAVDGFSQVELAADLGLSDAAARKRYQRALHRLRQGYAHPVSRSEALPGFSSGGAQAPSRKTDGAGFMTCRDDINDLARMPGLFRRWEFSDVLETRRTYRLEEAGAHADGTPLVAIYTSTVAEQADDALDGNDAATTAGGA
jgi:RNA polymerase sigma-70 factor (ECF subfamily)